MAFTVAVAYAGTADYFITSSESKKCYRKDSKDEETNPERWEFKTLTGMARAAN
jgi:hypothetical protein